MKIAFPIFAAAILLGSSSSAAGRHKGEAAKIEASVEFLGASGETTTDDGGITYRSGWWSYHEPKVYQPEHWGTFPLYFVGQTMRFKVTVRNKTSKGKKSFKVKVEAHNRVLETDGSLGLEIAPPQEWNIASLPAGTEATKEFSIYLAPNPLLPSGLDVTKIRIRHLNAGNGPDAGLIKETLAVWCPPDIQPENP